MHREVVQCLQEAAVVCAFLAASRAHVAKDVHHQAHVSSVIFVSMIGPRKHRPAMKHGRSPPEIPQYAWLGFRPHGLMTTPNYY